MAAGHFKGQRVGPYNPREGKPLTPLRALRLELTLTQRQAAQALGVADSTYRGLEGGLRELPDRYAYALREFKRRQHRQRGAAKAPSVDGGRVIEHRTPPFWFPPWDTPSNTPREPRGVLNAQRHADSPAVSEVGSRTPEGPLGPQRPQETPPAEQGPAGIGWLSGWCPECDCPRCICTSSADA